MAKYVDYFCILCSQDFMMIVIVIASRINIFRFRLPFRGSRALNSRTCRVMRSTLERKDREDSYARLVERFKSETPIVTFEIYVQFAFPNHYYDYNSQFDKNFPEFKQELERMNITCSEILRDGGQRQLVMKVDNNSYACLSFVLLKYPEFFQKFVGR